MRGALHVLLGVFVWAGATASAAEKPRPLTNRQLAAITAGDTDVASGPSGGTIVGNSSAARLRLNSVVNLQGSAQQEGRALNAVNAADSVVGNGLNVWDGRGGQPAWDVEVNLRQTNLVLQDQRRSSRLDEWKLEGPNVWESFTQARSVSFEGQVVTAFVVSGTITEDGEVQETSQTIIPVGAGFAAAGSFAVQLGAGSASISSTTTATTTTTTEVCFFFGLICRTREDAITVRETVSGSVTFSGFSVQVTDGAACFVVLGTCSTSATVSSTFEGERSVLFPAQMHGAEAEYIVISDGRLEVEADSAVLLTESAQQNLRVLHGVNAAASVVANGVNVARTPLGGGLVLNQLNTIVQYR